jgi:hypothetical protein
MKNIKLYSLISFSVLTSCIGHKTDGRYITTHNNSMNSIYCFYAKKELNSLIDSIPNMGKESLPKEDIISIIVLPFWEEYIKTCDNQKLRYYIIKKDSVDKYGWKEIFKKNIYNKKYLLTIEDLDKMKWKIEYKGE